MGSLFSRTQDGYPQQGFAPNLYLLHALVKVRQRFPAIPVAVCWPHSTIALAGY